MISAWYGACRISIFRFKFGNPSVELPGIRKTSQLTGLWGLFKSTDKTANRKSMPAQVENFSLMCSFPADIYSIFTQNCGHTHVHVILASKPTIFVHPTFGQLFFCHDYFFLGSPT